MTKQKTIKELERELKRNNKIETYLVFFFLIIAVACLIVYVPINNKIHKLETKLSECREKAFDLVEWEDINELIERGIIVPKVNIEGCYKYFDGWFYFTNDTSRCQDKTSLYEGLFMYCDGSSIFPKEYQEPVLVYNLFKTEHSFSFWTNYTGEWENYVVSEEVIRKFYRNAKEIFFDCKTENNVWIQEDVIEEYLCGIEFEGMFDDYPCCWDLFWDGRIKSHIWFKHLEDDIYFFNGKACRMNCQEQVPVCDFEDGYYGFKVKCDYWDWKVVDKHHYTSLLECEQALYRWSYQENCEVLK